MLLLPERMRVGVTTVLCKVNRFCILDKCITCNCRCVIVHNTKDILQPAVHMDIIMRMN